MSELPPDFDPSMFAMPTGDPSVPRTVLSATWPMFTISSLFLVARLYCRLARYKRAWWDDWLLVTGWGSLASSLALQTFIFSKEYLYTTLGDDQITPANLASDSLMKMALAFTKTSFALTLIRLVSNTKKWVIWVVVALTLLTDATMLTHAITVWRNTCDSPVNSYTFQPCWDAKSGLWMNFAGSIISGVDDFTLSIVPLAVLWNLQMAKREKFGVALAMSMGVIAGIVAVVKAVVTLHTIGQTGPVFGWELMKLSIYIHAEVNAAIIATSIPILRPLFRDVKRIYASGHTTGRQYIRSNTQSKFHVESQGRTAIVANEEDNSSETSILPMDKFRKGIARTDQVSVSHGNRNGEYPSEHEELELQQMRTGRR